ncbi:ParB/RepB/Spo0J family partition protein [Streptomyces sp. WAC04114]|nr:ParB/RepB/Spo0J family partition protein [Streptomyces sp. WAC04114]
MENEPQCRNVFRAHHTEFSTYGVNELEEPVSAVLVAEPAPAAVPFTGADPAEVRSLPVVRVPIAALLPGKSPRSHGPDQEHVARLAEIDGPLPPILVRRSDMRVIDGIHRLLAALLRGQESIDVEFFEGSADEAFLKAVQANITHGLPLSQADRRVAAMRIMTSHPQMSDRAIARVSGLGAKAVASIRRRSTAAVPQLNSRIGQDGRIRPLSSVEGRWRAAEVMAENPEASLREVARIAGISPATASDVRRRVKAGMPPASARPDTPESNGPARQAAAEANDATPPPAEITRTAADSRACPPPPAPAQVLDKLLRDPSLRLKEEGRHLLRLLQHNASAEWDQLTAVVPPHCGEMVGSLARQYAATWLEFAELLDDRDIIPRPRALS